jgi:hypothetical protein
MSRQDWIRGGIECVDEWSRSIRWFWRNGAVLHLSGIFPLGVVPLHPIHYQTHTQLGWNSSVAPNSQSKCYLRYISSLALYLSILLR